MGFAIVTDGVGVEGTAGESAGVGAGMGVGGTGGTLGPFWPLLIAVSTPLIIACNTPPMIKVHTKGLPVITPLLAKAAVSAPHPDM